MSTESIGFISAAESLEQLAGLTKTENQQSNFIDWVSNEIATMNEQALSSELELRRLATGETSNLHHVMMELEKSKTSFQLTLQVRNKVLEAYQEIMRMQI